MSEGEYRCETCEVTFETEEALNEHNREEHGADV